MTKQQIKDVIKYFGGITKCANLLSTSTQALSAAIERGHFSLVLAIKIDAITDGFYACENLTHTRYKPLLLQFKQLIKEAQQSNKKNKGVKQNG